MESIWELLSAMRLLLYFNGPVRRRRRKAGRSRLSGDSVGPGVPATICSSAISHSTGWVAFVWTLANNDRANAGSGTVADSGAGTVTGSSATTSTGATETGLAPTPVATRITCARPV